MTESSAPLRLYESLVAAYVLCSCAALAPAQNLPTASKVASVSAFGGISRVNPDYGPYTNYGYFLGGDVTRPLRHFIPSIEVRYDYATGTGVKETVLSGGVKFAKQYGRFSPYGDVLLGYGVITFQHPILFPSGYYVSDNSVTYGLGGGADYDLGRNFAAKGDFEYTTWRLGSETNRLTPFSINVGVVYHIPFKALAGRR